MFDQVIAVNVKGVFLGLRHVLPVMLQQKSGAIVNTASVAGLVATPGMPAYVASKHAVIGLTKTASGEVARSGVRVNAVCPGPVDTRMIADLARQLNPSDPGAVGERYRASMPTGRYTTPEEIANMVLFLCSDLAANITGAQYVIDAPPAERTAKELGGTGYGCDVSDRKAVDALAVAVQREVGAISVLVNNAGIIRRGTVFDDKARDDWDATMAVNLDGPYLMTT